MDARLPRRGLLDNGYSELPIVSDHVVAIESLPTLHKDRFDRVLVAQATVEGVTLLTIDSLVEQYPDEYGRCEDIPLQYLASDWAPYREPMLLFLRFGPPSLRCLSCDLAALFGRQLAPPGCTSQPAEMNRVWVLFLLFFHWVDVTLARPQA